MSRIGWKADVKGRVATLRRVHNRLSLKILLALALGLQTSSQAFACRIGVDQQLFEERPAADALPGAQIIHVQFSNARPAMEGWARHVADPNGGQLTYTLIGVARSLGGEAADAKPFPIYALVTSCSFFWSATLGEVRTAVDGDYYLESNSTGLNQRGFTRG